MAKKSLLYSCLAVDSSAFSPFLLYFGEKVDYVLLVNCGEGEGRGIKMADRSSWPFVERRYFFDIFLKKFLKNKWIVWYGLVNWDQWINVDGKNVWYSTIYCLTSPENEKISTKFFSFFPHDSSKIQSQRNVIHTTRGFEGTLLRSRLSRNRCTPVSRWPFVIATKVSAQVFKLYSIMNNNRVLM